MSYLTAGQEFKNAYPFIRDTYTAYDEDGEYQCKSWRPGVSMEAYGPYGDEVDVLAHGEGFQILTVVDVHKPGRYPTRVFYTRSWIDPDGKAFGKSRLRIATVDQFKRLSAGFRYAYDVDASASEAANGVPLPTEQFDRAVMLEIERRPPRTNIFRPRKAS